MSEESSSSSKVNIYIYFILFFNFDFEFIQNHNFYYDFKYSSPYLFKSFKKGGSRCDLVFIFWKIKFKSELDSLELTVFLIIFILKFKLDNFSKEELIKLIKKYVILQKQLKNKNEELTNRLNESNQSFSPVSFILLSLFFIAKYACYDPEEKVEFNQSNRRSWIEINLTLRLELEW